MWKRIEKPRQHLPEEKGTVATEGEPHTLKRKIVITTKGTEITQNTLPRGPARTQGIAATMASWGALPDFAHIDKI